MAQKTISVAATATLTANGTSTATGSIRWTVPALPDGVSSWDSVRISGTWSWTGRGSITRVTINGVNTSTGVPFDVAISGTSPLSITCVGNKNATGSSFTWRELQVVYTYTEAAPAEHLLVVSGGKLMPIKKAYVVVGGQLVEQTDIKNVFSASKKYARG